MPPFNTSSGFTDLNGRCEITGTNVTSYTSTSGAGVGSVTNLGGPGLNFMVTFATVTRPYHIRASKIGSDFSGNANDDGKTEESWAATATAEPAVAGQGY